MTTINNIHLKPLTFKCKFFLYKYDPFFIYLFIVVMPPKHYTFNLKNNLFDNFRVLADSNYLFQILNITRLIIVDLPIPSLNLSVKLLLFSAEHSPSMQKYFASFNVTSLDIKYSRSFKVSVNGENTTTFLFTSFNRLMVNNILGPDSKLPNF